MKTLALRVPFLVRPYAADLLSASTRHRSGSCSTFIATNFISLSQEAA